MKRYFITLTVLCIVLLVCSSYAPTSGEHKTPETGSSAPDFDVKGADAKMYSIASSEDAGKTYEVLKTS
jgi:hypothetical protein